MDCVNKLKILEVIDSEVILRAESVLCKLPVEPMIFCTGRNSIQFEYEKSNGDYLELEVYQNKLDCLMIKNDKEEELSDITEALFIEKLNNFFK